MEMCKRRLVKRPWSPSLGPAVSVGSAGPLPVGSLQASKSGRVLGWIGATLLIVMLVPFDGWLSRGAQALALWLGRTLPLGGELQRELEVLQQYGGPASIAIGAATVWLLDPGARRRLLDWCAALGVTGILVSAMKLIVGRARPKFNDPLAFLGPFGTYQLGPHIGVRHAWEFWNGISSDLWSMPSSHTAYAVVMSVFLSSLYPRLRPLTISLAALVGVCRLFLAAHYPSDVVAGAVLGYVVARRAITRCWGDRLLQWSWARVGASRVDHGRDQPTLPRPV